MKHCQLLASICLLLKVLFTIHLQPLRVHTILDINSLEPANFPVPLAAELDLESLCSLSSPLISFDVVLDDLKTRQIQDAAPDQNEIEAFSIFILPSEVQSQILDENHIVVYCKASENMPPAWHCHQQYRRN